ncbi:hypothetical protein M3175_14280 [Robertmurraya korlensis]|uniref:hypothetical protein n=1 Tax=Robertmurraya korlensis TaxID=519977 RepID=UPI00203FA95F|nr:hypothetical protein [Robertmurraya korlensis]MCM3601904.1 hypothetical protein [Robertmurraya korlensis]
MNDLLQELYHSNNQLVTFILGLVFIIIVVSIVRSVFRMVLPFVVIGLVMVVFLGHSPDDVMNKGKQFMAQGSNLIQNLIPFLQSDSGEKDEELAPFSEEDENKEIFKNDGNNFDINKF